jgi:hypothetical protein
MGGRGTSRTGLRALHRMIFGVLILLGRGCRAGGAAARHRHSWEFLVKELGDRPAGPRDLLLYIDSAKPWAAAGLTLLSG